MYVQAQSGDNQLVEWFSGSGGCGDHLFDMQIYFRSRFRWGPILYIGPQIGHFDFALSLIINADGLFV